MMADKVGTNGADSLYGSASNDSLYGKDGNDTLDGGEGNDYLSGGDGSDSIIGGEGDDSITGGSGNDIIFAGDGNDRINYVDDSGDDTIYGGKGNDLINFSDLSGKKTILGESGNDTLYGGVDADAISGGADNDTIYGNAGSDTLDGGDGDDNLSGGDGNDSLIGGLGNDSLYGNSGVDTLEGGDGIDLLSKYLSNESGLFYGGDGADTVWGSDSNDTIDGGLGDDSLSGYKGNDQVTGGAGNDDLSGDDGNDTLDGGAGNDSISGGAGNDRIYAGDGNDNVAYTSDVGDDTVYGGNGDDNINYNLLEGRKLLYGEAGNDTLYGGNENDTLLGGAGNDELTGGNGADSLDGGDADDSLYGNAGNDSLLGGEGNDSLQGNDGADTLDGGAGADSLYGDEGNDTYIVDSLGDYIYDSDGSDQAMVSVSWAKIPSSIEKVTYTNGANELPYWISALVADEASGNRYDKLIGDLNTFYYVFPTALPSYDKQAEHGLGYTAFNSTQKANTQTALSYISTVLDIKFVSSNSADQPNTLAFAQNNQKNSAGYAQYPDDLPTGSDVFLNNNTYNDTLNPGTDGAQTLIHEIGHALGLKHPFDEKDADGDVGPPPYLQGDEDNTRWTQMSYTQREQDNVLSYSPLDIAALQYLYGPSKTVRTGNDTYALKTTEANFVWDGVGNDTVSAVGANQPVTLYLEPGYWSYFGIAKAATITSAGQITINFGSVIEGAVGTAYADVIVGNATANKIDGGVGADSLDGGAGNDSLVGGEGNDTLIGGLGNDTLIGGDGSDLAVLAGNANDYVTSYIAGTSDLQVRSKKDGETDQLSGIEFIKFLDQTLSSSDAAKATYVLTSTGSTVSEGATARFEIQTSNVPLGTAVNYVITGISSADLGGTSLNGSVQVDNDGRATILLPIARDRDLEGDETLTLTLQGTSVSVLVKDTSTPTTPLFNEVAIAKILDAYSLQEKRVEVQTQDSALVQVLKFDGKWTTGFRADVQEFIDWHIDSPSGDKALGALNVDFTLSFIEQALVGLDRLNWINIVGLLADFKVTNGAYAFDGDFGG